MPHEILGSTSTFSSHLFFYHRFPSRFKNIFLVQLILSCVRIKAITSLSTGEFTSTKHHGSDHRVEPFQSQKPHPRDLKKRWWSKGALLGRRLHPSKRRAAQSLQEKLCKIKAKNSRICYNLQMTPKLYTAVIPISVNPQLFLFYMKYIAL